MQTPRETELYGPVKGFLEEAGYVVKSEVGAADVVACREGDAEPVIVELKLGFSLTLLQQAVARQRMSDQVYVAVPRWKGKAGWRAFKGNVGLCKRLGVGVISVRTDTGDVQVHADPGPFVPRKSRVRKAAMLAEFAKRQGDPNLGGSTRTTIVTAYRQQAMACADHLARCGPTKGAEVAKLTGVARATRIMADNHYGWFCRISVGIYDLTEAGRTIAAKSSLSV